MVIGVDLTLELLSASWSLSLFLLAPLTDLYFLELADLLELLNGVTEVLDYLSLLFVEDAHHDIDAGKQRNLHSLLYQALLPLVQGHL